MVELENAVLLKEGNIYMIHEVYIDLLLKASWPELIGYYRLSRLENLQQSLYTDC